MTALRPLSKPGQLVSGLLLQYYFVSTLNYGMTISRRYFLGAISAFAISPLLASERVAVDTILFNGRIWTVDNKLPKAEAIAISNGRIFAVGTDNEMLALATATTRKFDLGWKAVLPGFNDAHAHPAESGVEQLKRVACDKDSIEAIQSALRERAQNTPQGEWVVGFLYDDGKTPRPLNRADLDAVASNNPVLVAHRGGHTVFVNSAALKAAGIDGKTPDPPGGRYGHDGSGQLTGLVADAATEKFYKLIPNNVSRDDVRQAAALISKMFTSKGVTSACDADAAPNAVQGYQDARDAGELRFRTYCLIHAGDLPRFMDAGIHSGFGDDWLRIGGVKRYGMAPFLSGRLGSRNLTLEWGITQACKSRRERSCWRPPEKRTPADGSWRHMRTVIWQSMRSLVL